MTDDLERRLREIQNRPSRTEAENEELKARIQQLEAEKAEINKRLNQTEGKEDKERKPRETTPIQYRGEAPSSEIDHIIDKINKRGPANTLPFSPRTLNFLEDLVARHEAKKEVSYHEQKIFTEAVAIRVGLNISQNLKEKGYSERLQKQTDENMANLMRSKGAEYKTISEYGIPLLKELIAESRTQMLDSSSGEDLTLAVLSIPPKIKSTDSIYSEALKSHKQYYDCQKALEKAKAMRREGDDNNAHEYLMKFAEPIARKLSEDKIKEDPYLKDLDEVKFKGMVDSFMDAITATLASSDSISESYIENIRDETKESFEKLLPDDNAKKEYAKTQLHL